MIVLGLDSAITKTGWALVERDGGKETLIQHGFLTDVDGDVVSEFAGRVHASNVAVDMVVVEDLYFAKDANMVKKLARLTGRWQQAFEVLGFSTKLVMASAWQKSLLSGLMNAGSSDRNARKKACQLWVKATFGAELPVDEADAVGLAVYELRRSAFTKRAISQRSLAV